MDVLKVLLQAEARENGLRGLVASEEAAIAEYWPEEFEGLRGPVDPDAWVDIEDMAPGLLFDEDDVLDPEDGFIKDESDWEAEKEIGLLRADIQNAQSMDRLYEISDMIIGAEDYFGIEIYSRLEAELELKEKRLRAEPIAEENNPEEKAIGKALNYAVSHSEWLGKLYDYILFEKRVCAYRWSWIAIFRALGDQMKSMSQLYALTTICANAERSSGLDVFRVVGGNLIGNEIRLRQEKAKAFRDSKPKVVFPIIMLKASAKALAFDNRDYARLVKEGYHAVQHGPNS